jgi:transcriptional regulator with XRE-family HTH domain
MGRGGRVKDNIAYLLYTRKPRGKAIKKYWLDAALTQEQLAEKADLHWTYISGIKRGVRNVSIVKLAKIAAGLRLRIRDLVDNL